MSDSALIRSHLDTVVRSQQFAKAPRLRQLLAHLVESTIEGRGAELKESLVGVEVFGRPPDYDPKCDPVVRVQVKRVRERLESYYATVGAAEGVRIVLSRGSYTPQFTILPLTEGAAPARLTRLKRWGGIAALALASLVLAAALLLPKSFRTSAAHATPRAIHFRPFTSLPGNEYDPEWSPDATQVAFAWTGGETGVPHLYLMRDGENEPRRLSKSEAEELRPRWSPEGKRLAFYRRTAPGEFAVIICDVETGTESTLDSVRFLLDSHPIRPGMDWSPDGKWLAVTHQESFSVPARIVLISVADGSRRPATNPPVSTGDLDVRFSPDGRRIAFHRGGFGQLYVQDIPLEPSTHERPLSIAGKGLRGMAWEDNETLIYSSIGEDWGFSIARLRLSGGAPQRITPEGVEAEWPSYSRSSRRLLYTVSSRDVDIWKYSLDSGDGGPVASSTRLEGSPSLSPDGQRLAFISTRSGVPELWVCEADGSHPKQLTAFGGSGLVSHPTWSPDGAHIAFHARVEGNSDIYVAAAGDGSTRRVTSEGSREAFPSFSADGRSIYFMSDRTGRMEIFRSGLTGGPVVQVTETGAMVARETADGRLIVGQFDWNTQIWERARTHRNLIAQERGLPPLVTLQTYGDAVFYLTAPTGARSESRLMEVRGGNGQARERARLTAMPSLLEMGFALTPDRRHIYVAKEVTNSSDLFVAEEQEQARVRVLR